MLRGFQNLNLKIKSSEEKKCCVLTETRLKHQDIKVGSVICDIKVPVAMRFRKEIKQKKDFDRCPITLRFPRVLILLLPFSFFGLLYNLMFWATKAPLNECLNMPLSPESFRVNYGKNIVLKGKVKMNYLPEISFQVYDSQDTEIFCS